MPNTPVDTDTQLKTGRLKKRPEFLCVAQKGNKWISETVIVQAMETAGDASPRFGFTATKKIGNAVTRNRAKRRLRAAAEDIMTAKSLKSANIVLIARNSTATCDWDKLRSDLKWCLKRLDVIQS